MDVNDLKPKKNTNTTEPKNEKVISGNVKVKKKNELTKITDAFLPEDISNVKNDVVFGILIPSLKKTLYDVFTNFLGGFLFNDTTSIKSMNNQRISYGNYYAEPPRGSVSFGNSKPIKRNYGTYDYSDLIFETAADAKLVLSRMDDMLESYPSVSVGDLYDFAGVTCDHTAYNYGWKDIRSADVVRTLDGYIIKFPRVISLK